MQGKIFCERVQRDVAVWLCNDTFVKRLKGRGGVFQHCNLKDGLYLYPK